MWHGFNVYLNNSDLKRKEKELIDVKCNYDWTFRSSILISGWRNATMEFHRFHAFIYDRVPCSVRWMDWINVGLYASWRRIMHTIFLSHRCHWQFSRKYSFSHLKVFWMIADFRKAQNTCKAALCVCVLSLSLRVAAVLRVESIIAVISSNVLNEWLL